MPNKIGRFEVISEITKSDMGSVFKATDPESGQTVALKTLRLEMLSSEHSGALVQQILREAEGSKVLNSPNIAALYGAGEMEGLLCAAMEYVQGNSIGTMLARKEGFSIWDLLDISRQACQGLDHALSHNIFHYSLEPSKVMVTWDGTVKVLSFGVSMMGALGSQVSGAPPSVLHYMSPEQIHGDPLDARSNLFSWGAILYEMVTERKAFEGDGADAVRQKILDEMPAPPVHIHPKVHPALSEVIMKALSKSPEERYQNGQELVNDLEKCKESATKVAAKKSPPAPAPAAKAPVPTVNRAASAPKPAGAVPSKPVPPAAKAPAVQPPAKQESPRIAAASRHAPENRPAEPAYSAKKASAAAAGLDSGGTSSATTPKLDPSAQFISSCVKASVEAIANDGPNMSAAVEEEEAPSVSVDPMMAEEGLGKAQGPSFSEIEELPPLKEIRVASPPPQAEPPEPAEARVPVLVTPQQPPKPKVQPREVAKKAVKEISKTPPKLFAYSIAGAVAVILVVIVAIAYHIRSQNEDDEDVAPAAAVANTPAPAPAQPATQAPAPVPEAVVAEPIVQDQPEVTIKPRYTPKRKGAAPPVAPVVIPGQLTVNTTPEGALVHVDGQSDSGWITPYNLTGLSVGRHTVVVSKNGFAAETRTVDMTSGSKMFLVVQLAPSVAVLSVTSDPPGASIYVDGHDTGRVTPADVHADKGSHTLLVRKQGYLDETANANVQIGQTFHFAPVLRALGTTDDIKTVGKFKKLFGGGDVAGMGMVSIKTQPKGAQVAVNRRIVEKATPVQFYLNPGNYEVDITYSGYKTIHRVINVEKSGKVSFDENLERE
jgi:eukaryotic-like serine/threonine-protein kinase